jgi:Flp pilus assembly protein TadD
MMNRAFDEAIDAFMKLSAELPDDATVLLELGAAYSLAGRFNEAIAALEPALAIVDEITAVREMELLARSYLGASDEANARRVLRERGDTPSAVDTVIEGLRDSLEQQRRGNAGPPAR